MMERAGSAPSAGQAAIADAVFSVDEEREMIGRMGRERSLPFLGIWLDCETGQRVERVEARFGDASDAEAAVAVAQSAYPVPQLGGWEHVNANASRPQVLDIAGALLRERQMLSETN